MSIDKTGGTEGRVYGGNPSLIHVKDGTRAQVGAYVAHHLDTEMRLRAFLESTLTADQALSQKLCPGCYMVVLFNAAVRLAKANGQSLTELGNSMSAAFKALAEDGPEAIEEIEVLLDPCEVEA
jgi:hypothetical protein